MIIFAILTMLFVFIGFPLIISYGLYPNETSKQIKDLFNIGPKYNVQDEMNLFNDAEWVKKVILSCNTNKQIWNAYDAVARLWHQTACSVAANCGFRYPEETEKDMKDFIQTLRDGGFPEDD